MPNFPTFLPKNVIQDDDKQRFGTYLNSFEPLGRELEKEKFDRFLGSFKPFEMPEPEPVKAAPPRPDLMSEGARIARDKGFDEDAAKVVQAILKTEGALSGEVGDKDLPGGGSFGVLQFYGKYGMLPSYAKSLGMDEARAGEYARQNPQHAIDWALGGYLGNAIREGQAKGLKGAELATYAQQYGQRSQSPERAGQNYNALFGGNAPIAAHAPAATPRMREQAIPAHGRAPVESVSEGREPVDDRTAFAAFLDSLPPLGSALVSRLALPKQKEKAIPAHGPSDKEKFEAFLGTLPEFGKDPEQQMWERARRTDAREQSSLMAQEAEQPWTQAGLTKAPPSLEPTGLPQEAQDLLARRRLSQPGLDLTTGFTPEQLREAQRQAGIATGAVPQAMGQAGEGALNLMNEADRPFVNFLVRVGDLSPSSPRNALVQAYMSESDPARKREIGKEYTRAVDEATNQGFTGLVPKGMPRSIAGFTGEFISDYLTGNWRERVAEAERDPEAARAKLAEEWQRWGIEETNPMLELLGGVANPMWWSIEPVQGAKLLAQMTKGVPGAAKGAAKAVQAAAPRVAEVAGRAGRALVEEGARQGLEMAPMRAFAGDLGEQVPEMATKRYYHVAPPDYRPGEPIYNADDLEQLTGQPLVNKWIEENPYGTIPNSDYVSLYENAKEAQDFSRDFLGGKGQILEVNLPDDVRTVYNREGYPMVRRVEPEWIRNAIGLSVEDVGEGVADTVKRLTEQGYTIATKMPDNPAFRDVVERTLARAQEQGRPAIVMDDVVYLPDGKYVIGQEPGGKGRFELQKVHDLSESGFLRGLESSYDSTGEWSSYNRAAQEMIERTKAERRLEQEARAAREATEREAEQRTYEESQRLRQTLDEQLAGTKFGKLKAEIALLDGSKTTIEGPYLDGLIIHKQVAAQARKMPLYTISHAASGMGLGMDFATQTQAKVAAMRLANVIDWTRPATELTEDMKAQVVPYIKAMRSGDAYAVVEGVEPTLPKPKVPPTIEKPPEVAPSATQAEREAARANFEQEWQESYGNRPETEPIVKPERAVTPQPELTGEEARKVAKMTDAELAEYNAKKAGGAAQRGGKPPETIADRLAGKTTGRVGTLIVGDEKFPLSLRPDNSEMGAYSVVLTTPQGSTSYRMMLKKGEPLEDAMRHFEDYMNTDSPSKYKVEVSPRLEPKPKAPMTPERQWWKELKELQDKRFKSHNDEILIDRLKKKMAAKPEKWQIGQGVGWRVSGKQINRGFRIIEVRPETKEAVIRSVADTGLTTSGGNYDKIEDQVVSIIDLMPDKKYDMPVGGKVPVATKPIKAAPTVQPGDTIRTNYSAKPAEVISEGSIPYGKKGTIEGYRVRLPDGTEDFIARDDAVLVKKGNEYPDLAKGASTAPLQAAREPWMMSAEDYVNANIERVHKSGENMGTPAKTYLLEQHAAAVEAAMQQGKPVFTGAKPVWQRTQADHVQHEITQMKAAGNPQAETPEMLRVLVNEHKQDVQSALEDKWFVPDEVLRDYPDLLKQYGKPTPIGSSYKAPPEAPKPDYGGFLDTKPPMARKVVEKTLDISVMNEGKPISRKALVERMIDEGATVQVAKNGERRLMKPDGGFLSEKQVTKTGMDYAEHLAAKVPEPTVKPQGAMGWESTAQQTIADRTGGTKITEIGRFKQGTKDWPLYLRLDREGDIDRYSVVIPMGKEPSVFPMRFQGDRPLIEAMQDFERYANEGNMREPYRVEVADLAAPADYPDLLKQYGKAPVPNMAARAGLIDADEPIPSWATESRAFKADAEPYRSEWITTSARLTKLGNGQLSATWYGANHVAIGDSSQKVRLFLQEALGRQVEPYREGWLVTADEAAWLGFAPQDTGIYTARDLAAKAQTSTSPVTKPPAPASEGVQETRYQRAQREERELRARQLENLAIGQASREAEETARATSIETQAKQAAEMSYEALVNDDPAMRGLMEWYYTEIGNTGMASRMRQGDTIPRVELSKAQRLAQEKLPASEAANAAPTPIKEPLTEALPIKETGPILEQGKPIRFEVGKKLTEQERKQVLRSIGDVYKEKGAQKVLKGIDQYGEERYGYEYSPDLFEQSAITGKPIRYYIKLPDGRIAHPSELFPEMTDSAIEKALAEERYQAQQVAYYNEQRLKRVIPVGTEDAENAANAIYSQRGRPREGSYFAKNDEGQLVRVDGQDAEDMKFFEEQGFKAITEPVPMKGIRPEPQVGALPVEKGTETGPMLEQGIPTAESTRMADSEFFRWKVNQISERLKQLENEPPNIRDYYPNHDAFYQAEDRYAKEIADLTKERERYAKLRNEARKQELANAELAAEQGAEPPKQPPPTPPKAPTTAGDAADAIPPDLRTKPTIEWTREERDRATEYARRYWEEQQQKGIPPSPVKAPSTEPPPVKDTGLDVERARSTLVGLAEEQRRQSWDDMQRALGGDAEARGRLKAAEVDRATRGRAAVSDLSDDELHGLLSADQQNRIIQDGLPQPAHSNGLQDYAAQEWIARAKNPNSKAAKLQNLAEQEKARRTEELLQQEGVAEPPKGPPVLPKMEDNRLKPLSTYVPTLYRETNIDDVLSFVDENWAVDLNLDMVYFSNTKDLALGQGKNTGVLIELDSKNLRGYVNTSKPTWDFAYQNGAAEFIGRYNQQADYQAAVKSITIQPGAKGDRARNIRLRRVLADWEKIDNPDGSVTYVKPSPSVSQVRPILEQGAEPPKGPPSEPPKVGVGAAEPPVAKPPEGPPSEPPKGEAGAESPEPSNGRGGKGAPPEPEIPPSPPPQGAILPRLPANKELEARIDRPGKFHSIAQTLDKIPGVKGVVEKVDPWIAQQSHVERIPLMFRAMEDIGANIVRDAMTHLEAIKLEGFEIKGNHFVKGVTAKAGYEDASLALSDVLEHSYRYDMPDSLRKFIRTANNLNDELVKWADQEGVKFKKIKFEPGGHYFGRIVREVRDVEKRMKARPDMPRAYDSMEYGIEAGVKYEDDLLATSQAGYDWLMRKIIARRMQNELGPLGRTAKELVEPNVLKNASEAIKHLRVVSAYERTLKAVRDGMTPLYGIKRPNAREGMDLRQQFLAMDKIKPGTALKLMDIAQMEKGAQRTANVNELLTEVVGWRKEIARAYQATKSKRAREIDRTRASEFAEGSKFGLPEGTIGVGPIRQGFAQGKLFPRDTADYLNKAFSREQSSTLKALGSVNDAIRTLKTGFDLGTINIQLLPTMMVHPKAWSKATFNMFNAIKDPSTFAAYMGRPENQDVLRKLVPHGLSIEGLEYGAGIEKQGLLGKVLPEGVRSRVSMAFLAPINVGKMEIAKALLPMAERKGELDGLAMYLNNVTGTRSGLAAGLGPRQRAFESTLAFFSPRVTRSGLALVGDAMQGGIKGAEARKALAGLTVGAFTLAGGLRLALGQEITPEFFNPTSPEFATVELFGRRVGFGGVHRSLVSLIGQSVKTAMDDPDRFIDPLDRRENPLTRWWTGRTTPVTSMLWDIAERKDFTGAPLQTAGQWASWLAEKPAPMWAQEYVPGPGKKTPELAGLIPDVVGLRAIPLSPAQERDKTTAEVLKGTGKTLKDLSTVERWEVSKEKPEINALAKEAVDIYAERGSAYHEYKQALGTLRDEKEAQIKTLGLKLKAGQISGNEYRDRVAERERDIALMGDTILAANPRFKEAISEIEAQRVKEQKATGDLDRYLDGYYRITKDLIDESTGTLDVEELLKQRKELKERYPEDVVQRAMAYVNRNRDPEYVKALDLFSQYMDIPKYIGMSEDKARKADEIGRYIREMSRQSGSTARARVAAIKKYQGEYALYSRAQSRGVNVKRKIFWRKNPLLSKYFSDVPLEPQVLDEAS